MHLNSCDAMRHVPEIKLIRTDTTLDLSQKAEKVWFSGVWPPVLYATRALPELRAAAIWFCTQLPLRVQKSNSEPHAYFFRHTQKKKFQKKKKHKSKLIFAKIKKVRTTRIPIQTKKEKIQHKNVMPNQQTAG